MLKQCGFEVETMHGGHLCAPMTGAFEACEEGRSEGNEGPGGSLTMAELNHLKHRKESCSSPTFPISAFSESNLSVFPKGYLSKNFSP